MLQTILAVYGFMGTMAVGMVGLLVWAAGKDGQRQNQVEQTR
jgi:hypothetical protein